MKRYLGLTEEEITENSKLWKEERSKPELETTQGQDLRSIGVTPAGMESDITTGEELAGIDQMGGTPGEAGGVPPMAGGAMGAATPAGAPAAPGGGV